MRPALPHPGSARCISSSPNTDSNDSQEEDTSVHSLPISLVTTTSPDKAPAPATLPIAICIDDERFTGLNGNCSTFEEYLHLSADFQTRYELVDGRLIWRPRMADPEHDSIVALIINRLTEYYARTDNDLDPAITPSLYIPAARRTFVDELGISVAPLSPTDSPSSRESKGEEVRIPDIAVGRARQSGQGPPVATDLSTLTYNKGDPPPHMVIEVTSKSTRQTDLNEKFRSYARAGVDEYVIIDRHKTFDFTGKKTTGKKTTASDAATPSVIVCSSKNNGGLRCSTGDPEVVRQKPPTRASTAESPVSGSPGTAETTPSTGNTIVPSADEPKGLFYRNVFRGTQTVECSYLSYFNLTADEILKNASAHETRRREVQQDRLKVRQLERENTSLANEAAFWKRKAKALEGANDCAERRVTEGDGEIADKLVGSPLDKRRKMEHGER